MDNDALWDAGVDVCAPVHDAVLIECDTDAVDKTMALAKAKMVEASSVSNWFPIRVDDEVCHAPDLLGDSSGAEMWARVNQLVPELSHKGCQQCQIPFLIY